MTLHNKSRVIRYVKPGTLPGCDLLSLYDRGENLLIVDADHFERLSDVDREIVLQTECSALLIEYPANRPPRIKFDGMT